MVSGRPTDAEGHAPAIRVLVLLPNLRGGGSERVMLTLLRHFDRRRFVPTLAVVDGRADDMAADLPGDIVPVDLRCTRVRHAVTKLAGLIRAQRPHVVLSTLGHLNLMLAMLRPLLPASVRLVGRESSLVSANVLSERRPAVWRLGYRLFYRRFDRLICQSSAMQADLCSNFRVPAERTVVIPNPVDLARIDAMAGMPVPAPAHEGLRFVTVGRLSPEKGFDTLLHALHECRELPWRLDMLGHGPEAARLQALVDALQLSERVRLHGFVANPFPWVRQADALLLGSRHEGLPNAVLEALACGTPVISTPEAAALEILQAVPGAEIAADFSATAFADALRRWAAGPRRRIDRESIAPYAAAKVVSRYERALADVAGL